MSACVVPDPSSVISGSAGSAVDDLHAERLLDFAGLESCPKTAKLLSSQLEALLRSTYLDGDLT